MNQIKMSLALMCDHVVFVAVRAVFTPLLISLIMESTTCMDCVSDTADGDVLRLRDEPPPGVCPLTAAPRRCGFNLYLPFNTLHRAQYAQQRAAQSSNKAARYPAGSDSEAKAERHKPSSCQARVWILDFSTRCDLLFDSFQSCSALIC